MFIFGGKYLIIKEILILAFNMLQNYLYVSNYVRAFLFVDIFVCVAMEIKTCFKLHYCFKRTFLNCTIYFEGVLVETYKKWLKTLYIIANSILYLDIFAVLLHIVNVLYLSLVLF